MTIEVRSWGKALLTGLLLSALTVAVAAQDTQTTQPDPAPLDLWADYDEGNPVELVGLVRGVEFENNEVVVVVDVPTTVDDRKTMILTWRVVVGSLEDMQRSRVIRNIAPGNAVRLRGNAHKVIELRARATSIGVTVTARSGQGQ
jgi:hypothetical protein